MATRLVARLTLGVSVVAATKRQFCHDTVAEPLVALFGGEGHQRRPPMPLLPPALSELDLVLESDASIDPLGLQATYERLADRILPGVTVRMTRPRFLTAMAVGAHVCAGWDDEDLAADGVSPPWIVFEWFVVESLVRCLDSLTDSHQIAGIQKVSRAIRDHGRLSAPAYLKTPKVFGFTGIFKRLAIAGGVLTEDLALDDAGITLVRAWENERGLPGFLESRDGPGAAFRGQMQSAVRQGMEKASTTPQSKAFWQDLSRHLEPGGAGRREQAALFDIVRSGRAASSATQELVTALESRGSGLTWPEEAEFLREVQHKATDTLLSSLAAIDAYERLCRPITDAFNLVRHLSAVGGYAPIGPPDFVAGTKGGDLVSRTIQGVQAASDCFQLLAWESGVRDLIDHFRDARTSEDLFRHVVARHESAQQAKPPHGKRAWIERHRGESVIVRSAYGIDDLAPNLPLYVHEYRTPTLSRFLADLGRF